MATVSSGSAGRETFNSSTLGRKEKWLRTAPRPPGGPGVAVSSSPPSPSQQPGQEPVEPQTPHSQVQGPASLSKDGVELLGDVAFLSVPLFLASAHHHIGVCLAVGVRGSQVGSLGGRIEISGVRRDTILETEALVGPDHRVLQGAGGQTRASSTLVKHSVD